MDDSAAKSLRGRDARLTVLFRRIDLVGEMPISEEYFRGILNDLRDFFGSELHRPARLARICPHLAVVAMVFTARYDYKRSFWSAFQENLGVMLDPQDQGAWGKFFRDQLAEFQLFLPPQHWMVNVFPVLYHAIIPEATKDDFAIMVRSLIDAIDIRDLDDAALLAAVRSYDLPASLESFFASAEWCDVACDLIRQVSEDYRQSSTLEPTGIETSTIRGALLAAVLEASVEQRQRFVLQRRPLVWRWDLGSGEIGAYLTGNPVFDDAPLRLRLHTWTYDLDYYQDDSGRWSLSSRLLPISMIHAGSTGQIEFASGKTQAVTLAQVPSPPLFFRASGNAAALTTTGNMQAGLYAIAASEPIDIRRRDVLAIEPVEIIPRPHLPGIKSAGLYELNEGDSVRVAGEDVIIRGRMRPEAAITKISMWSLVEGRDRLPVYSDSPRIRFESRFAGSGYQILRKPSNQLIEKGTFDRKYSIRADLRPGSYRATVREGRSSIASSVDFAVLPIRCTVSPSLVTISIFGEGTLHVGGLRIALNDTPANVATEALVATDLLTYEYDSTAYQVQFVGQRPTMWRFGSRPFSQGKISCNTADVADNRHIEFRGSPGAPLTLTCRNRRQELKLDADGRLSVALSTFLADLQAEQLDVAVGDGDDSMPCFSISQVPIAQYVDLHEEKGTVDAFSIVASVALDQTVDHLYLVLEQKRKPWLADHTLEFNGFGRSWELRGCTNRDYYSLSLIGACDTAPLPVLTAQGERWRCDIGQRYDRYVEFDAKLLGALRGSDDDLQWIVALPERRLSVVGACASLLGLRPASYDESVRKIFGVIGARMLAGEIGAIHHFLSNADEGGKLLAGRAGLPLAAARDLSMLGLAIDKGATTTPSANAIDVEQLSFFLRIARVNANAHQAADVINTLADDPLADELVRAYATLLRLTLATILDVHRERLESEVEAPDVWHERQHASQLIESNTLPLRALLDINPSESLFAKLVSAMWLFSLASRLTPRLTPERAIPRSAVIASRWLYDRALQQLMRAMLKQAEIYLLSIERG
jgi:hypothetical protein